jgi:ABC-2 type transport system permease protein
VSDDTTDGVTDGGQTAGRLGTVAPSQSAPATATDRLRDGLLLFYTILKKDFTIVVRYPINLAGGLASMFIIFLLLVEGGRQFGGPTFAESLDGVVVGYLVFMLATFAYQGLANSVNNEAQWGTLERLHLSPMGFGRVMIASAVSTTLVSFSYLVVMGPLAMFATGEWLVVDLLTIVPLAVFGIASVLGLGFIFGGASVVYKRIGSVFRLLQFGFPVLIAAPVEQIPWVRVFPVVQANVMLGRAMRDGVRLWEFSPDALATLVAVGVGYFLAGYAVFLLFVRRARRLGVMGDY